MISDKKAPANIDEYIALFPTDIQTILQQLREAIHKAVPDASEKISYQMPSFWLNGILVYFAACKNHIGFYPTASGIAKFLKELKDYKCSKGAVQFPIDKPLPLDIITEIVNFRVNENNEKAKAKKTKRRV